MTFSLLHTSQPGMSHLPSPLPLQPRHLLCFSIIAPICAASPAPCAKPSLPLSLRGMHAVYKALCQVIISARCLLPPCSLPRAACIPACLSGPSPKRPFSVGGGLCISVYNICRHERILNRSVLAPDRSHGLEERQASLRSRLSLNESPPNICAVLAPKHFQTQQFPGRSPGTGLLPEQRFCPRRQN